VTATVEHSPPRPRLLVTAAVVPLVALGVLRTAVLLLVAGIWGLLAGFVVTAVVVALRARALTRGIRRRVLASLGARPAGPDTDARLVNLADGLSATSGVPVPDLFILDDPGANMLLVGEASATPAVVITSGLLDAVDRIQLEAVVAWAFAELRQGDLPAASVAVTTVARSAVTLSGGGPGAHAVKPFSGLFSAGYAYVADPDRDLLLDQAAVALTRYPPGLRSALEQLERVGTTVGRAAAESAHLWMADPGVNVPGMPPRPALELRVEALRLL
jgi:heat shock protein HtpX